MPLLNFYLRVHAVLVAFYPVEFRRAFGSEMNAVFRDQMAAAVERRQWLETLLIWKYAMLDIVKVGLPLRLTDSLTMAAILSASVTPLVFWSLIWSLGNSMAMQSFLRRAFGI